MVFHHRTDDWMSKPLDGASTIIPPPASDQERLFSTAYNYCVTNWCQDSSKSLFTLRYDENFEEINKCDAPYVIEMESAVIDLVNDPSINQDLHDICTYYDYNDNGKPVVDFACVVDGLCGDTIDAHTARNDMQDIINTRDQMLHYSSFPMLGNVSLC